MDKVDFEARRCAVVHAVQIREKGLKSPICSNGIGFEYLAVLRAG